MNSFAAMEEHLVSSSIGNKLCRVKGIEKNVHHVTLDSAFVGYIRKDGGGWMLEEYFKEELLAENVQLIANHINRLPRQFNC